MTVKFNYSKLKGRIVEKYGSQAEFAKKIGLSERTISLKLTNKVPFKNRDIIRWCYFLTIPGDEIDIYFFNNQVQ